jgi:hypothetical protein
MTSVSQEREVQAITNKPRYQAATRILYSTAQPPTHGATQIHQAEACRHNKTKSRMSVAVTHQREGQV